MERVTGAKMVGVLVALGVVMGCAGEGKRGAAGGIDVRKEERGRVLRRAEAFLHEKPLTVTAYPVRPGGGSVTKAGVHDFYSEADYSWPDPKDPHAPYVGRDGYSYEGAFFDHRRAMWRFDTIVPTLTAAYELTREKKYAESARGHLRAWFIDEATRMNPSLNYAQAIPNKSVATQYGLIDTLHLLEVARSVVVLRRMGALPAEEDKGITEWFAEYLKWLRTSELGVKESNGTNNHSCAYWLQVAVFADVTGDAGLRGEARERFKTKLMPQMAADGHFPRETARTKPYGYSLFQLDLMVMLAKELSVPGDNLWEFKGPQGQTVHTALEWMYPFVVDKTTWKMKPDVAVFEKWPVRSPAWLYGGRAYGEEKYLALWERLEAEPTDQEILRNLPVRTWVIWEDKF